MQQVPHLCDMFPWQVAKAAVEARQQAEAATEERIEAAVAERVNSRLMESMRKARDLGRQKARHCVFNILGTHTTCVKNQK